MPQDAATALQGQAGETVVDRLCRLFKKKKRYASVFDREPDRNKRHQVDVEISAASATDPVVRG